MRRSLLAQKEFAAKLTELEQKFANHDVAIREIIEAIQKLAALPIAPEEEEMPKIGFRITERPAPYRRGAAARIRKTKS